VKPTLPARAVLLRLAGFLRPFTGWVALSVLLSAGTTAAGIGLLGTSAYVIATAALHPSIAVLQVAIVGVRFFGILRGLLRYGERLVAHAVNFRLLAGLRVWFAQALEPLAPARLVDTRGGDLLSRAVSDIDTLESFYVRAAAPPLAALLVTLGMAAFTGQYAARLGAILAGGMLLGGLGVPLLAYRLGRRSAQEAVTARAALQTSILDSIQGLAEVLAYGQGAQRLERARGLGQQAGRAQMRSAWVSGLGSALGQLSANLTLLAVLLVAIPLVSAGALDGVLLAVISLLVLASFEAVLPLPQAGQQLQLSVAAGRRLFALADASPAVVDPPQPRPAPEAMDVRIRGLTFRYAPDLPPALDCLDVDLPPGRRVALVGASGAGKTTLANLLLRFWDVPAGSVLLNGADLRGYAGADVRARMAVISQSTYLFSATVAQNLRLAKADAGTEELLDALRRAGLEDWLASLPQGLDTWVGEHGTRLSGGERQRLAAARVILRDARLVILDEPTANLDALTARRLMLSLEGALAGKSWLWITHQLGGVVERMDEILVLDCGRVVERGTHARLVARGGLYAAMLRMQNSRLREQGTKGEEQAS
jgi:ATP-binding cassette subfamily C protein CydC